VAIILGLNPGGGGEGTRPEELLIWVAVMLVSILVHECGHAVVQRRFGGHPWITLHGFGGLASCDDCDRSPRSQILISLAGPGAGFIVALLTVLLLGASGHTFGVQFGAEFDISQTSLLQARVLDFGLCSVYWAPPNSEIASELVGDLLTVNILWGLINLLPIYPLDGGQVAREVCTLNHPSKGIVWSLQLSIVTAGLMALFGALAWGSLFVAIMFGFFAYSNYRTLEAYQASRW
jgi:Zn-dependent protease